jgi:hypothetical protein
MTRAGVVLHFLLYVLVIVCAFWPQTVQASCASGFGVALPPACTGAAACQCLQTIEASCHPSGDILKAFVERGGCATFGRPLSRARPRLAFGGTYQTFEHGEIAKYPTFVSGANTPDFSIAAFAKKDRNQACTSSDVERLFPAICVYWGSTKPFSYSDFLVRWDREDNEEVLKSQHKDGAQQAENTGAGDAGAYQIDAKMEGTYSIYIEGCNFTIFGRDCDQGWSFPVYVDLLPGSVQWELPSKPSDPAQLESSGGLADVPDRTKVTPAEEARIVARLCDQPLQEMDPDNDHFGELNGIQPLARLRAAQMLDSLFTVFGPPAPPPFTEGKANCTNPGSIRIDVNNAIIGSEQKSKPGTDVDGTIRHAVAAAAGLTIGGLLAALLSQLLPIGFGALAALISKGGGALVGLLLLSSKPGDYDMRLIDYIVLYNGFGADLSAEARAHLVEKLLSVRGGADKRQEVIFVGPIPFPETENHVWSTEIARYLTNNILYDSKPDDEFDNDKNGMTQLILGGLQQFLVNDFYELNARPYAAITYNALEALANYAAVGTNCIEPPTVTTIQSSRCDVRRAARSTLDFLNARFALSSSEFRRAAPFRRRPEFKSYPRLLTNGGDDMSWRLWAYTAGSDFQREERNSLMMETADGYILSAVLGNYRPPLLVTDLMRSPGYPADLDVQRFRSRARDSQTAEVYYRGPDYLISAGGRYDPRYDDAKGLASLYWSFSTDESAWALPTTLMPLRQGDDIRDFIRIQGSTDPERRNNLCVGPGFACGMNPIVPAGLPEQCQRKVGNWTFIDFTLNTPGCPFGYSYYTAVYSKSCISSECKDAAGDPKPGSFGFVEVTSWRTFDDYIDQVIALNPDDFEFDKVNVYRSPNNRHISFVFNGDKEKWDIVGYGDFSGTVAPERRFERWPVAEGPLMSSPRRGCVFVDNLKLNERLIIDHTETLKPRRTVISLAKKECGCPLIDACLSPRAEW